LNTNEEPFAVMFFFRNKHIMCDFGTGNNNKMNFVERNRQDVVNILEAVYRGATKGKGQVNSPKGMF
jgi:DIM1 family U5 snRNP protein